MQKIKISSMPENLLHMWENVQEAGSEEDAAGKARKQSKNPG
jgi:hypothetical protein